MGQGLEGVSQMTMELIIKAIIWSGIAGIPVSWAWPKFLFFCLDRKVPPHESTTRIEWIPALVGVFERSIIALLLIFAPKLTASFIAGWTALKVAGGWGLLKDPTTRNRAVFFIGLLGNCVSFGIAIGVGIALNSNAISILNN